MYKDSLPDINKTHPRPLEKLVRAEALAKAELAWYEAALIPTDEREGNEYLGLQRNAEEEAKKLFELEKTTYLEKYKDNNETRNTYGHMIGFKAMFYCKVRDFRQAGTILLDAHEGALPDDILDGVKTAWGEGDTEALKAVVAKFWDMVK